MFFLNRYSTQQPLYLLHIYIYIYTYTSHLYRKTSQRGMICWLLSVFSPVLNGTWWFSPPTQQVLDLRLRKSWISNVNPQKKIETRHLDPGLWLKTDPIAVGGHGIGLPVSFLRILARWAPTWVPFAIKAGLWRSAVGRGALLQLKYQVSLEFFAPNIPWFGKSCSPFLNGHWMWFDFPLLDKLLLISQYAPTKWLVHFIPHHFCFVAGLVMIDIESVDIEPWPWTTSTA